MIKNIILLDSLGDEILMTMHAHNHMNKKTYENVLECESLNDRDHDDEKNKFMPK